jgi:hypothetical protein
VLNFNFFNYKDEDGFIGSTKISGFEKYEKKIPEVGEIVKDFYDEDKEFLNLSGAININDESYIYIDNKLIKIGKELKIKLMAENMKIFLNALYNFNLEEINRPYYDEEGSIIKILEYTAIKLFNLYDQEFKVEYIKKNKDKEDLINILKEKTNIIYALVNVLCLNLTNPVDNRTGQIMLIRSMSSALSILFNIENISYKNKYSSVLFIERKGGKYNINVRKSSDFLFNKILNNFIIFDDRKIIKKESNFFDSKQYNIQRKIKDFG